VPLDLVALGEVMLRLDPGETRIAHAREFKVWEGGGNTTLRVGSSAALGLNTAIAPHWSTILLVAWFRT